jgi:GNAT superfamily N-acetyltransferase
MVDWTIRRAEIRDADRLSRCIDAAYAQYTDHIPDLPQFSADCAGEIANHLVWVAEADGEIVGGLVLVRRDGFVLLANVVVHPNNRGTGIGQRLLTLAERETVGRGYAEMRLNTHVQMPENIQLYARNGWAEIGRTGTKVTMKKNL